MSFFFLLRVVSPSFTEFKSIFNRVLPKFTRFDFV